MGIETELKDAAGNPDFGSMLSIKKNVFIPSDHRAHAWALRVIGQDVGSLRPEYLQIHFTGALYVVRMRVRADATTAKKRRAGKLLRAFRRRSRAAAGQHRESPWHHRTYTLSQIARLDDQALVQRKEPQISPDIYALGERLRTVGEMIEAKGGQLAHLTLDNTRVAFSYREATGQTQSEEHSMSGLYRSQQDSHSSRGSGRTRDRWLKHQARSKSSSAGKLRLAADRASGQKNRPSEKGK
jgi:hypothetical protein